MKKKEHNYCFVCGDTFTNIKEVESHIKNQFHEANMRDFISTIPSLKKLNE
jgi:tRNA U54 and U55 pseudouridine synthase Pus10